MVGMGDDRPSRSAQQPQRRQGRRKVVSVLERGWRPLVPVRGQGVLDTNTNYKSCAMISRAATTRGNRQ